MMAIKHQVHPLLVSAFARPPCNPPQHDVEPPKRGTEEEVINHYEPG